MYNIMALKRVGYLVSAVLLLQVVIGIITVISSKGSIPVFWGVLHQAGALVLLTVLVFTIFVIRIKK